MLLLRFKYRCAATLVFGMSMPSQDGTEKQTNKQITGKN
jgi:hypothetical protein